MKNKSKEEDLNVSNFDSLKKKYGSYILDLVSNRQEEDKMSRLPLNLTTLHVMLGGGIPLGHVVEIFGAESTGKTTLALQILADAQRQGLGCALIDAERCYIPEYGEELGVSNEKLFIATPLHGEQAFEIMNDLIEEMAVKMIVVDSVAALQSKEEAVGETSSLGSQARMMGRGLRKLVQTVGKMSATVIFINQIRKNVNTGPFAVNPDTTPGGLALKFFSVIRLDVRKIALLRREEKVIGAEVKLSTYKNKTASPHKNGILYLYNGKGFSSQADLIRSGEKLGLVSRKGVWFEIEGEKFGAGLEKAANSLSDKIQDWLRARILDLTLF